MPALIEAIRLDYVRQKVEQGGWQLADAEKAAVEEMADSFPQGRPRDGHEIYLIRDDADQAAAEPSGFLWVGALRMQPQTFYVFDVGIRPEARGRGWGRAAMRYAEERALARGCTSVMLHVFGDNTTALELYRSLGYRATDLYLKKPLTH